MKKIFLVAFAFFLSWEIVSADGISDSGKMNDLSQLGIANTECQYVPVKWNNNDELEMCNPDDADSFWMFYRGVEGEKAQYSKYCTTLNESIPILRGGKSYHVRSVSGDSGVDLTLNYVSLLYKFGSYLIGFICVLIMVVSGVQIIIGGMSSEGVSQAKTRILAAIASLILLLSSVMILKTINPNFFGG